MGKPWLQTVDKVAEERESLLRLFLCKMDVCQDTQFIQGMSMIAEHFLQSAKG